MRILLDESVPRRLSSLLAGHTATTVARQGWAGVKNGELLALAAAEFDVLITADRNIEYQQNLLTLPLAVLVLVIRSNRLEEVVPLVPEILRTLDRQVPRTLQKVIG